MSNHMSEMLTASIYCPSQKTCQLSVPGASELAAVINGPGYRSLYDDNRQDLDKPAVRKDTFIFFPEWSPVYKHALIDAGFYFTGDRDTVKCFYCELTVSDWKTGDDPMEVHRTRSPQCQFVLKTLSNPTPCQRQRHVSVDDSEESDLEDCIDGHCTTEHQTAADSDSASESEDEMDGPQLLHSSGHATSVATSRHVTHPVLRKLSNKIDKNALRRENERMRSTFMCRLCRNEKVQTLFLPCRHLVACESCAERMDDCMTCHQKILGTVRTYLI